MGLMSKIKGIFMEEVIVEEDDEEEVKRENEKNKEKVQVAKKIENPTPVQEEPKEVEEIISYEENDDTELEDDKTKEFNRPIEPIVENEYKFPMEFDDRDFEMEERKDFVPEEEPEIIEEEPVKEEPILYHERRVDREVAYDFSVADVKKEPYESGENKKGFQRSPIISPVYGILDKNYKKDDVVSKREIRLTTNNKKADLDLVREKAYGDLANDITESIHEEVEIIDSSEDDEPIKEEKDSLLYDLSEDASPSVKDVTVGDAEEYFNDLGLEYNVDYKVEKEEPSIKNEDKEEAEEEEKPKVEEKPAAETEENEDELFDLIDAMYDSK